MLIHFDKICRLCMISAKCMVPLFEDGNHNVSKKIMVLIPTLKIYVDDNLPSQVCQGCVDQIKNFESFKLQCENSDIALNKYLYIQKKETDSAKNDVWIPLRDDVTSETSILSEEMLEDESLRNDCKIEEEFDKKFLPEAKEDDFREEISESESNINGDDFFKDGDLSSKNFPGTCKMKLTNKTIPCYICGKILIYRRRNEHIRRHIEGRTHKCNKCGKMFSEKSDLKKHFLVHSELRAHMCDKCGKRFKHLSNLKAHHAIHTGQKSHVCDVCGKGFTQIGSFKSHKLLHTGVKPFSCDICGKSYVQKTSLQIHLAIHAGQKQHACEICGKGFIRKGHLITHMSVHTGEKKFSCDICGMSYTQRQNLKKHKRKHEQQ